jgi:hypothetical protein
MPMFLGIFIAVVVFACAGFWLAGKALDAAYFEEDE